MIWGPPKQFRFTFLWIFDFEEKLHEKVKMHEIYKIEKNMLELSKYAFAFACSASLCL